MTEIDEKGYINQLKKAHYKVVGRHSAVSTCHWTLKSLKNEGTCYKQLFYGIQSHRCLQMSPSVYCQQKCVFCWRYQPIADEWIPHGLEWDEPKTIIDGSEAAQRALLSGYPGNDKVDKKKIKEAMQPNQVAISLTGEPTLYPYTGDLINGFRHRGYSTFLVTNGLLPERLAEIELPTQLYVSLDAPDEATHRKVNIAFVPNSWKKINETLELLPSLDTRKALRITLVRGWNDFDVPGYARLVEKSQADFVEIKSYMHIGSSRERLPREAMMSHDEIKLFAEKLAAETGYKIEGEQPISRVVMLSSGKKDAKIKGK